MKKVKRHLSNARREIRIAVERTARVEEQIGLRRGHKIELVRQARETRDEADRAIEALRGGSK